MFVSDALHAELLDHRREINSKTLRTIFETDSNRSSKYLIDASGLCIDFSKSLVTDNVLVSLRKVAIECDIEKKISAMFSGVKINTSENRSVLHTALRADKDAVVLMEGSNVIPDIQRVLSRMEEISSSLVSGAWLGATGKAIDTVVNIGIGGSDLGPSMASHALSPFQVSNISQHFVSNVDPTEISSVLERSNPETTLFIVASKTFTTNETILNATIAKQWLIHHLPQDADISHHFIALSTNDNAAVDFGVRTENILGFWDWVGGRFSLSSAIGLSLMIRIGTEQFRELLRGMRDMDTYFQSTPFEENAIVMYSLIGIWYRNYLDFSSYAILPYDTLLSRLPAYLQQLIMESNGKQVDVAGRNIEYNTSFVIWGEPGTNGQHSFHQLLHQGTDVVPVDFLFAAMSPTDHTASHEVLIANALAQAHVLAFGSEGDEPPHKHMPGNHPSITIMYERLSPYILGQIIAFYEHVVFTQGAIWNINSFDQWGVELGKKVAGSILPWLRGQEEPPAPEKAMINRIQQLWQRK